MRLGGLQQTEQHGIVCVDIMRCQSGVDVDIVKLSWHPQSSLHMASSIPHHQNLPDPQALNRTKSAFLQGPHPHLQRWSRARQRLEKSIGARCRLRLVADAPCFRDPTCPRVPCFSLTDASALPSYASGCPGLFLTLAHVLRNLGCQRAGVWSWLASGGDPGTWKRMAIFRLPISTYHTYCGTAPHVKYLGEPNAARYTCIYKRMLVVGRSHYPNWKYWPKGLNSANTTHRFLQQHYRLPYIARQSSGRLKDAFVDMYQRLGRFRLH